jgi:hypothetical protein
LYGAGSAELVVGGLEVLGEHVGGPAFDVMALHHVDQLAVFEEGNCGAAGWVGQGVLADALHSFYVKAGKGGEQFAGKLGILKGSLYAGAHRASGAATDTVEDHNGGAFLGEGGIYSCGVEEFGEASFNELGFHGVDDFSGIHGAKVRKPKQ